jgi:hypothetical protein
MASDYGYCRKLKLSLGDGRLSISPFRPNWRLSCTEEGRGGREKEKGKRAKNGPEKKINRLSQWNWDCMQAAEAAAQFPVGTRKSEQKIASGRLVAMRPATKKEGYIIRIFRNMEKWHETDILRIIIMAGILLSRATGLFKPARLRILCVIYESNPLSCSRT